MEGSWRATSCKVIFLRIMALLMPSLMGMAFMVGMSFVAHVIYGPTLERAGEALVTGAVVWKRPTAVA